MKDDILHLEPYQFVVQARGGQLGEPPIRKSTLVLFRFTYWHFLNVFKFF